SAAFSLFRIWDLFRISSFGFRISLPDWRCSAKKMWSTLSTGGEGWGERAPFMVRGCSSSLGIGQIPVLLFRGLPVVLLLGALCATVSARAAQMNALLQSW